MQILIDLSVEEYLMLSTQDFDAKINAIVTDIAAIRSAITAILSSEVIPDSVGTGLDSIQAIVTDFKNSVMPPAPIPEPEPTPVA
jgi:hypothetical protein